MTRALVLARLRPWPLAFRNTCRLVSKSGSCCTDSKNTCRPML
jgi:hypothetical protein